MGFLKRVRGGEDITFAHPVTPQLFSLSFLISFFVCILVSVSITVIINTMSKSHKSGEERVTPPYYSPSADVVKTGTQGRRLEAGIEGTSHGEMLVIGFLILGCSTYLIYKRATSSEVTAPPVGRAL